LNISLKSDNKIFRENWPEQAVVKSILKFNFPHPVIGLGIADMVVMYLAISTGLSISYASNQVYFEFWHTPFSLESIVFISLTLASLLSVGVYSRQFLTDMKMSLLAIIVGHGFSFGYMSIIFYVFKEIEIWRSALLPALLISTFGIFFVHVIFDRLASVRLFRRRVLVFGGGTLAARALGAIERSPYLDCVGYVPGGSEQAALPASLCLHQEGPLLEVARRIRADEIVTAVSDRRAHLPMDDLLQCRLNGFQVTDFSSFIERQESHVEIDGLQPSWIIFGDGSANGPIGQRWAKRLLDVVCSLALILLSAPVVLFVVMAILVESRGPVLYRQRRVGLNNQHFTIWKFRSMANGAEQQGQARWSSPDDPRVTRVGRLLRRTRLDELPQVWNVLSGDMSFVGPRPERPEFVSILENKFPYYDYRHVVKPGISGWAQIHYPYGNTEEDALEKLKYDLYYVKNYSLVLDFIVLVQTLRVILWPTAATNPKVETLATAPSPHAEGWH